MTEKAKVLIIGSIITVVLISGLFYFAMQKPPSVTADRTIVIQVVKGQKLVSVHPVYSDIYYTSRPMRADEQPETLTMQLGYDSSRSSMYYDKIILQESK